jgi:hypothetical protein
MPNPFVAIKTPSCTKREIEQNIRRLRSARSSAEAELDRHRPQRKEVLMAPPDQPAAIIAAAFGRASA